MTIRYYRIKLIHYIYFLCNKIYVEQINDNINMVKYLSYFKNEFKIYSILSFINSVKFKVKFSESSFLIN